MSKESLIMQLYKSMSGDEFPEHRADDESKYDVSTGTLYCNNQVVSKSEIEKALNYFQRVYDSLKNGGTLEQKHKAMYHFIAIEAIKKMQEKKQN